MFCLRNFSRNPNVLFSQRLFTHPNSTLFLHSQHLFSSSAASPEAQKTLSFRDKRSPAEDLAFQAEYFPFYRPKKNWDFIQPILDAIAEQKDKSSLSKQEKANLIRAYNELGDLYEEQTDCPEAEGYREALNLMHDPDVKEIFEAGDMNNSLGRWNLWRNKLGEAEDYLEKAKEIFTKLSQTENVTYQLTKNKYMIGKLYEFQDETEKALDQFKGILKKIETEKASFERDFVLALVYQHMGNVYSRKGDSEKAKKYWDQSMGLLSDKSEEYPTETLNFYNDFTWSLTRQGLYKEAIVSAEKSLQICQTLFSDDPAKLAETLFVMARVYSRQNDHAKAIEIFKKVENILWNGTYFHKYHRIVHSLWGDIAQHYHALGKEEEASIYHGRGRWGGY